VRKVIEFIKDKGKALQKAMGQVGGRSRKQRTRIPFLV
jgi:hypothetical protein